MESAIVESLERRRRALLERVEAAARRCGRDPASVGVVAVTKTVEPELAACLVRLGQGDLGESRAAELERKAERLRALGLACRWHFIGHLQRNKARRVLRLADEIHSVDSLALIDTLARLSREEGRRPRLYLEVKLAPEATKSGFPPEVLPEALERARGQRLAGLMTMAPRVLDGELGPARATFTRLAELARSLPAERFQDGRPRLSMGMSGDFEAAIEAGAGVVRIGSAFFAELAGPHAGEARGRGARGA